MKPISFSTTIAEQRSKQNQTMRQIASETGVSAATIFKYERGESFPSNTVLKKLCDVLNLSYNEMLVLVQQSKAESKASRRKLVKADRPEWRDALLERYDDRLITANEKDLFYSVGEIASEIKKEAFHPIEQKLIEEINTRLLSQNRTSSGKDLIKLYTNTTREKLIDELSKIGFKWTFAQKAHYLCISFWGKKKGTRDYLYFIQGWTKTKPRVTGSFSGIYSLTSID